MENEKNRLVADHRVGDYELVEVLGSGNIGTVFRARSTELPRDFALKLITVATTDARREVIEQTRDEVRALASFHHPHVVGLVDAFPVNATRLAIVREYVDAQPLDDLLDDLSPEQVLAIVRQLVSALRVIHDKGFVHGDIKPSNILVGWPYGDDRPHAYLVDFDLESYSASAPPGTGLIESPEYASPERVAGESLVPGSDFFSLGAVVFEAMTGESPFAAPTMAGVLRQHLEWSRPDLSRFHSSSYPESFCRLVERMLDPDPAIRSVDASELSRDAQDIAGDPEDAGDELQPSISDTTIRLDSEDRVWVQSGVVYVDRPGWDRPKLIECEGSYALHAVSLKGAVAFSTRDQEIWLIIEDGPTKTFTISGEPESLVAADDGERLVVSTESGRRYEAKGDRWMLRERIPVGTPSA